MRRALGLVLAVAVGGCATLRPTHTQVITPADAKIAKRRRDFDTAVPAVLQLLAESDVRLAARYGHGAGGDPFLLLQRKQFLDETVDHLARIEIPITDELAADPRMAAMMEEERVLEQLVASEEARLAREGDLAHAAIDIIPAVAAYADQGHIPDMDADTMLAWRLHDIREKIAPNTISGFQREELRAELAALGRRGPKTQIELTAIGKKLELLPVAPYPLLEEAALDKELGAFVGLPAKLDGVEPFLEQADQAIRFQLDVAFGVLRPAASDDVKKRAVALLAKPPPCFAAADVKTAREMAPPEERTRSCGLVRALSIAQTDIEELAALLALHHAVITAGRSASMHGRVRDPQVATRRWSRVVPLAADAEQHELLLAANHPTKAIAGGAAAGLLTLAGGARAHERAREWMRFGDASFDVVEQHLAVMPRTRR
jgi:hypothetical protein